MIIKKHMFVVLEDYFCIERISDTLAAKINMAKCNLVNCQSCFHSKLICKVCNFPQKVFFFLDCLFDRHVHLVKRNLLKFEHKLPTKGIVVVKQILQ